MFEAVICDWDGTLADTRKAIVISFQKSLKEINLEVSAYYVERRMGSGAAETFRDILAAAKKPINEKVVKQLVKRKIQVQLELANEVALFEGARELLQSLRGKVKVGLASMNNRSVVIRLLEMNNLTDCFDAVLTVESVSHSKPNPEIFLKTAAQLKAFPEQCVVLEDSLFGVKAAKSAMMSCIAVTTGVYTSPELKKENADLIVKSLKDPQIFKFIVQET